MAGSTDFIVNLRVISKEMKKQFAELKKSNAEQAKSIKSFTKDQRTREKDSDKAQKRDRAHLQWMSREESKRNKTTLGFIGKQHATQQQLMKKNLQLQQRLQRQGGGGAGRGHRQRRRDLVSHRLHADLAARFGRI